MRNLSGLALLLALTSCTAAVRPKTAVRLSEVQTLTLRGSNARTTHRRVSSIPQLKCISSPALCKLHEIDVMRCDNTGFSYDEEDIEWTCKATLPEELKLGSTDVICEGYSSSEDPYVLKGSCGVEYRVALTKKGEERWPHLAGGGGFFKNDVGGTDWSAWFFLVFFVVIAIWIALAAFAGPNRVRRRPRRAGGNNRGFFGGGGGGGGGGWGPGNDPPPPYPGYKQEEHASSASESWRPGFWSGAAAGVAGGYFAGATNRWGRRGSGDTGLGSGSSSRASRPSSSTTQATGFGSTRRR